jgi:antirestriction protein ArdC
MDKTVKTTGTELMGEVKNIVKKLAEETDAVKRSAEFKRWISFCGIFHKYSFNNAMLIMLQYPEASLVAGFHAWKKRGRYVKKGEKAIKILAPRWYKTGILDPLTGEEIEQIYFGTASVFDISQTEGKEIPQLKYSLDGDSLIDQYLSMVELFKKENITLEFEPLNGAQGVSCGGRVVIDSSLDLNGQLNVMFHEYAHEKLHQAKSNRPDARKVREYQAEITAAIVLDHFGMDTTANATYLASWQATENDIKDAFNAAFPVAAQIIKHLTGPEESETDEREIA